MPCERAPNRMFERRVPAGPDTGQTIAVTVTGLSSAQDNAIFNQSSFESEFGSGSIVV